MTRTPWLPGARRLLFNGSSIVDQDDLPFLVLQRERNNAQNLYRHTVGAGVANAVIAAFLPIFAIRLGASVTQIGLLTSLPAALAILIALPSGAYARTLRDLVRFVTTMMAGYFVSFLAMAMLPTLLRGDRSVYIPSALVALATFGSLFITASNPAWSAVLADSLSPRQRPVVNGQRWALASVVGAMALALSSWFLSKVPLPINYQALIIGTSLAGLFSLIFLARIELLSDNQNESGRYGDRSWRLIREIPRTVAAAPGFLRFLGSAFVFRLGIGLPAALIPVFWVETLQATDAGIGYRAMAAQVALVLAYVGAGRATRRFGHLPVLVASAISLSFYALLTGLVPNQNWLIPVAVLWGLATGSVDVANFETLISTCPPKERVVLASVNDAVISFSIAIGPWIGIGLSGSIGVRASLAIASLVALCGALLFGLQLLWHQSEPAGLDEHHEHIKVGDSS
jgi:MFS family permease